MKPVVLLNYVLAVSLLFFITSCTFTTTMPKQPVFKSDVTQVDSLIMTLVKPEGIDLTGRETSTNGKSVTEMEIDIINGENIPGDGQQLRSLGNSIASVVKSNLKDQNEYNTYKVSFTKKEKENGITTSVSNYVVYKSEEVGVDKK